MLVLSRKVGQEVVVGDNIHVTVVAIRGDRVRIGFTAPNDVAVHREEVFRRIHEGADTGSRSATGQVDSTSCLLSTAGHAR